MTGNDFFPRGLCCASASTDEDSPGPRPRVNRYPEKTTTSAPVAADPRNSSRVPLSEPPRQDHNHNGQHRHGSPPDLSQFSLPVPPSQFINHLAENPDTNPRDLLRPFLGYETWLRRAFASGDGPPDGLANLVDIYGGQEQRFNVRASGRDGGDRDKFMMRLPDGDVREPGSAAIAASLDEYQRNFGAFTHAVLAGLDWSGVVAAGSSALLPLLPKRDDVSVPHKPAVEDPLETYYQTIAGTSDIDLFLYGMSEDAAIEKIKQIESSIRKNQRLSHGRGLTLRTANAITFISPRWPHRHVQIILRLYKSISEILTGFDVDCACVAFDGTHVYTNPRGVTAISTRTNSIDVSRRSPSYETRLFKYRSHLFDTYWGPLDRSRVNMAKSFRTPENPEVKGLARLLFYEYVLRTRRPHTRTYYRRRLLRTIHETGEPTASGYASIEIPYSQRYNAEKVQKFVRFHSREPHVFGDIDEVLDKGADPSKRNQGKLQGRVTFLKDDPGRQMIGSFYPLTDDDWADSAYTQD